MNNTSAVEQGTSTVFVSYHFRCNNVDAIEEEITILLFQVQFDQNLLPSDEKILRVDSELQPPKNAFERVG